MLSLLTRLLKHDDKGMNMCLVGTASVEIVPVVCIRDNLECRMTHILWSVQIWLYHRQQWAGQWQTLDGIGC